MGEKLKFFHPDQIRIREKKKKTPFLVIKGAEKKKDINFFQEMRNVKDK